MGAIRLFISDIDGTLVKNDKSLSDGNIAAVRRLVDAGIAVSLISARPPSGMLWIAKKLGLAGPFAAFNGGILFDADGTLRSTARLDDDVAGDCLSLFRGRAKIWLFAGGRWYAQDGDEPHSQRERLAASLEPEVRQDFTGLARAVDKIVAVSDDHAALDVLEGEAKAQFGTRANIVRSQAYYLDVTAPSANKGDGVAALAAAFGVPLDAVAVAGDMFNDVPMFARAKTSFAMAQAPEAVRKAATFVSGSNEDDGVAQAIDRLLAGVSSGGAIG